MALEMEGCSLISREVRGLERALDALSTRFTAEANNIANINTPHYARQTVNFEEALGMAIDSESREMGQAPGESASDMLELFSPTVTSDKSKPMRVDGNGTSLELEMSTLVQTGQKYNAVATQLATQYRTFKYITDQK